MKKVVIIGGGGAYSQMFQMYGWQVVEDIHEADLIQFTGGADVSPEYYGEEKHPATGCNLQQDRREADLHMIAYELGIPQAGICRGGQFLNVINGGRMYQHVNRHGIGGTHAATDVRSGKEVRVSSTHHQMMRPHEEAEVLTIAHRSTFKEHMLGKTIRKVDGTLENDVEAVLYDFTKCLCFQPHPEFVAHSEDYRECADYYFECLELIL